MSERKRGKKGEKKSSKKGGKIRVVIPEDVSFKYVIPDPCPQLYINGAAGGLTQKLEIQLNLYFERPALPKSVKHKVNQDGTLGEEITRDQKHQLIRLIQSSIVMDITSARAIAKLLNDKSDLAEKLKEEKIHG